MNSCSLWHAFPYITLSIVVCRGWGGRGGGDWEGVDSQNNASVTRLCLILVYEISLRPHV